jgi:thiamine-phosphate pyrophosphorylase
MTAAERGADYVMFGEPEGDRRPAFDAIIERINWWAEVFQIPCVGFAASLDEVEPLAAAGADFVAIGPAIWQDAGGAAAAVRAAAQRIAGSEALA